MERGWEQQVLEFIHSQQQADGSFLTELSGSPYQFESRATIQTVFIPALMLRFLLTIDGGKSISEKLARYLLSQQTELGTWNYWHRGTSAQNNMPLPDDLDDTACAITALLLHQKLELSGTTQAQLARALIACESQPGGPYKTWLTSNNATDWNDIDPVVNANIGHLLKLQNVQLPSLVHYFDTLLADRTLASPYYFGSVPLLFFLSEWYHGSQLPYVRNKVHRMLSNKKLSALQLSLLIIAGRNYGISAAAVQNAQKRLRQMHKPNNWHTDALYIHRTKGNRTEYAGSAALTAVCILRALADSPRTSLPASANQQVSKPKAFVLQAGRQAIHYVTDKQLRAAYLGHVQRIVTRDVILQITEPADIIASAYNSTLSRATTTSLNLGSLNGWIAYTIYDDIIDNEADPLDICVANLAHRESLTHFRAAIPESAAFNATIDEAFSRIDAANLWELTHARASISGGNLSVTEFPDYNDYSQLANRSWGHTLAACGVLYAISATPKQLRHQQQFYTHYLIARQLNDDAHDWESDLTRGHMTATVTALLQTAGTLEVSLASNLKNLRNIFWNDVAQILAQRIEHHTALARTALLDSNCTYPQPLLAWLEPLERAARDTLRQQARAKQFIREFTTDTHMF